MPDVVSLSSAPRTDPFTWDELDGLTLDGYTWAWDEVMGTRFNVDVAVSLNVAEGRAVAVTKAVADGFVLTDGFARVASYLRTFEESLGLQDAVGKDFSLHLAESLHLLERWSRAGRAVFSDMLISQGEFSTGEFEALLTDATGVGFTPFQSFMEGDLEYQRALMRATITSNSSTRLRVENLRHQVDVPDVFDSGSATLAPGGVRVNFSRRFYAVPEVNVILKAGSVFAVPRVREIDLTGFTVEVFDKDGNSMAGLVSWAAHGY